MLQGTTTNGAYLLDFRTGAFLAGLPVKPVVIAYPWRGLPNKRGLLPDPPGPRSGFNVAWESIAVPLHFGLMLSQLINRAVVYEVGFAADLSYPRVHVVVVVLMGLVWGVAYPAFAAVCGLPYWRCLRPSRPYQECALCITVYGTDCMTVSQPAMPPWSFTM